MMNKLEISKNIFENIKHIDEFGHEFWYARELIPLLEYKKWQKFRELIKKSMEACKNSNNNVHDHFTQVGKMVSIGSKLKEELKIIN